MASLIYGQIPCFTGDSASGAERQLQIGPESEILVCAADCHQSPVLSQLLMLFVKRIGNGPFDDARAVITVTRGFARSRREIGSASQLVSVARASSMVKSGAM